jgi:membrane-associated phospholipid phosphatase
MGEIAGMQRQGWKSHTWFDPDARGGLRLTLAVAAGFVLLVPFALALVAVTDRWEPLRRLDLNVAHDLNTAAVAHPALVTFLKLVSDVFSPTSFEVVAVLVGLVLLRRHSPRLAAWLVLTVVLTDPLDTLVKDTVARARPSFPHPVLTLTSYSFPSGHAFGSIVGVGALLLVGLPYVRASWRRPLIALGVGIVLLVGYARIGLGVHYVSDVLGGWLLGTAWLAGTTAAFRAWRRDLRRPTRPLEAGLEPQGPEPAGSAAARREA